MTELVKVKIKGTVITNQYGTLTDGSILATSAEFAKHLVDDCSAAEYIKRVEKPKAETKADPVTKKTGKGKNAAKSTGEGAGEKVPDNEQAAFEKSGMSVAEWLNLADSDRENRVAAIA